MLELLLQPHVTFDQTLSGLLCLSKGHPPHFPTPSLSASVHAGPQKGAESPGVNIAKLELITHSGHETESLAFSVYRVWIRGLGEMFTLAAVQLQHPRGSSCKVLSVSQAFFLGFSALSSRLQGQREGEH